jgi:hypothetical protein
MKKKQILWAIVFGSMLAITGCGGDETTNGGDGGSGGSGGTGGTGGSGGMNGTGGSSGSANTTCEAICGATCIFGGITPGGDFAECVNQCNTNAPDFNDDCGSEMAAYLDCLVDNDCSILSLGCANQAQAWSVCSGVE